MSIEKQAKAFSRAAGAVEATKAAETKAPASAGPAVSKQRNTAKESKPKTAAKSERRSDRRVPIPNEAVITVKGTEHELRGKRGTAVSTLKNGMSVEQFKAALAKKGLPGYGGWALATALKLRLITVK